MLTVCTWLWGKKYNVDYVKKLQAGLARHLKQKHRFVVVSDYPDLWGQVWKIPEQDRHLLQIKGCYARLRMFDPWWQTLHQLDDRLVCIDLDTVITGNLDPLFDRPEPFLIMRGGNVVNPCPYNGAMMMLRPGAHPEVWQDFTVAKAAKVPFLSFPDDQGWIAAKVPNAAGWDVGKDGVYIYAKPGWTKGKPPFLWSDDLPADARLVTFSGKRDPIQFPFGWIKKHWVV